VRALFLLLAVAWQDQPVVRDLSHASQVLGSERRYIAVVPPSYDASQKRYPVLYWLYGYEQSNDTRAREIAAYAAARDFIVVSAGPVETVGEFPLYFPELVAHVDRTLRTLPDRARRAVAGAAMGGFLAIWTAGQYPDLVASGAALNAFAEAPVGPRGFPVDSEIADRFNHDEVRTLQSESVTQFLEFVATGFAAIPPALGREASAPKPVPGAKPATPSTTAAAPPAPGPRPPAPGREASPAPFFRHADPYPNFTTRGWEVVSNRRRPGFTILENVGPRGFRSSVREWVPGGATLPAVKLSLSTPARQYPPGSAQTVTYIRLRDRNVRRVTQKADAQGRLSFDLDGDAHEVGISAQAVLTASGYDFADAAWATAGKPVTLKVLFWNKGAVRSGTAVLGWESPSPGVTFVDPVGRVYGLAPGESASIPVTFTAATPATIRIVAVDGANRIPLDVPVHPPAEPTKLFQLADGVTVGVWRHGSQQAEMTFGEGNRDNQAAPGETFAVLFPDGEFLRAAEVFTNDPCVDNSVRASDSLGEYASVKYSLPAIRSGCEPGHIVRMLARVVAPGVPPRYWSIEFPVWFRP
jgi:poly(3-hydroxybutyrate) depolymerase